MANLFWIAKRNTFMFLVFVLLWQAGSLNGLYVAEHFECSQAEAERYCQARGGYLCSFSSEAEFVEVGNAMVFPNVKYWTGLKHNVTSNSLEFSDGTTTAFANGEVSININNGKLCVLIQGSPPRLKSQNCSKKENYICIVPSTSIPTGPTQVISTDFSSTLSSSDNIQLTSTPSSSDIDQLSTFSSSDIDQLTPTPSSSDIDQLSTFSSSDIDQLTSTPSSSDIDQLSTLSSSANIQLVSTPSSSNNQFISTSSSDNQLKSTPSLSDINQVRSTPLSSVSNTEQNAVLSSTRVLPTESKASQGTHQPTTKVKPYKEQMYSVNISNENSLSEIINITETYIKGHAQDNATNKRGSLFEINYVFEQRLVEYAQQRVHAGSVTKETSYFALVMRRVLSSSKKDEDEDIIFPRNEEKTEPSKYTTLEDFIVIPKELFSNESIFVGVLYYDLDYVLIKNSRSGFKDEQLNTKIISAEIYPKPSGIFRRNITFTLKHRNNSGLGSNCVFIRRSNTKGINTNFSNDGCSVLFTNDSHTTCTCNHMTSFAVLTRVKVSEDTKHISKAHNKALSVITYVGIALSLIGEGLTVASFVFLIGLQTEQAHLHTNLALSLGLAQIFFLISFHSTSYKPCCIIVTALVHYLYLVTFNWMLCEGFHLYLMVVKVFNEESYLKKYYLFSWITPLVVVVISIIVAASMPGGVDRYISENICWVSAENHFIWAFLGPVLLVCLANLVLLFLIVKEMTKMNKTKDGPSLELRKSVKACLLLFPILGTTWVFCVLTIVRSSLVFEYIFNVFNSLQGFFIFLFHVVRSSEIRAVFQRKRLQWGTTFDMSNNVSTFQKTQTTRSTPPASAKSIKPILGTWVETGERESPDLFCPSGRTSRNQVLPAVDGQI